MIWSDLASYLIAEMPERFARIPASFANCMCRQAKVDLIFVNHLHWHGEPICGTCQDVSNSVRTT